MPLTEKYSPVFSRGFKPSQKAPQKKLENFLWFFPFADLEAGKLLTSEFFDAFEEKWFLCIKARKNMRGGMCLRQSLYRCRANRAANFNLRVIEFKLGDLEAPLWETINVRPINKEMVDKELYCSDVVEEPLLELRRRYAKEGIVCFRLTLAIDPEPSTWDRVTDEEFFGMEGISFDDQPISSEHSKLESGACDLPREMVAGNDEAEFKINLSSGDESINTEPPKLESGVHKLPQEKVSERDKAKSTIDPKSDDEPINAEPPELKSAAREFPQGDPTELNSSGNSNLDDEVATKATSKNKRPVNVMTACMLIQCVAVTATYHTSFSWIWAALDLIAFFVIYWGMYRKPNGENAPTAEDYEKAHDYFTCLLLALICTYNGVCYVSPFFFFAIYLLYTNRVTRKISLNAVYQLLRSETVMETQE